MQEHDSPLAAFASHCMLSAAMPNDFKKTKQITMSCRYRGVKVCQAVWEAKHGQMQLYMIQTSCSMYTTNAYEHSKGAACTLYCSMHGVYPKQTLTYRGWCWRRPLHTYHSSNASSQQACLSPSGHTNYPPNHQPYMSSMLAPPPAGGGPTSGWKGGPLG